MSTDRVSDYIQLFNQSLSLPPKESESDAFIGKLDALWYSLNEGEMARAEAAVKILLKYHEGRK